MCSVDLIFSSLFFSCCRLLISDCGLTNLVADTRFLTEASLLKFLTSLTGMTRRTSESSLLFPNEDSTCLPPPPPAAAKTQQQQQPQHPPKQQQQQQIKKSSSDSCEFSIWTSHETVLSLVKSIARSAVNSGISLPSACSCAWMEMVLVEVSLRNRDRFATIWPVVGRHYCATLNAAAYLSYITER